ncbi:hypothetical protein FEM33_14715 [Dyadobacter flavalbus]|uniref:Uncharacterized protein n=1 Tax=Dyadobacter flavalbus TaxID=2579942 RepID=A0A5M8QTN4_9BACT|nr:hypothetical protein [Dyadobacter flavalbus]KAA6439499.1 hypothetical protein FEM33_14715 [Dyadobacter flavalbus]
MMKALRYILVGFFTWLIWLLVSQYLLCARYQFDDPVPFEGTGIYNPYDSLSPDRWMKCNFHAHSRAWEGITNGHGTAEQVHKAYKKLRYDFHCVSNYHYIDTTYSFEPGYIPAYEHGYNISKTHQLILGATDVKWLDYLFPQSIHNKQHVLDDLKGPSQIVILNHPALRNGYTPQDLAQLSGYDCMEVLSPSVISTNQWDAALSSGKKAFLVGDDDIHDVLKKERLGQMCTFVNVPGNASSHVLSALKTGRSYGVVIGNGQVLNSLPGLDFVRVKGDSVIIKMSRPACEAKLYGQHGRVLTSRSNSDLLTYKLSPKDHYARATFEYSNGTSIYLNPVFYTSPSAWRNTPGSYVNTRETAFFRTLGIIVLFSWLLMVWTFLTGRNIQRHQKKTLSFK